MRSCGSNGHVRWPAARLYWGVLDASTLGRISPLKRDRSLGYLFESVLPGVPIEDLQTVYLRLLGDDDRYLACGAQRAVIEQLLETEPEVTQLTPEDLPEHLHSQDIDPARLNLLTGRLAPKKLRALRRRSLIQAAVILLVISSIVCVGLERRRQMLRAGAQDIAVQRAALVEAVIGASSSGLPDHLRLTAQLRQLEQTRHADPDVLSDTDASDTLGSLLLVWPDNVQTRVETVSVTSSSVTVRCLVASMTEAQGLADAVQNVPGWTLIQPRSEARPSGVDVTLRLARQE